MRNVNGVSIRLQAHRGVSTDCPENTMAAFRAAVAQGYDIIELDPKFTKDDQCVVLHDRTLNRTARNADGSMLNEEISIADITFAQARSYDYGLWHGDSLESIPLLAEALDFASANAIPVKIDKVIERFTDAQTELLFDVVEKHGAAVAGFTCTKADYLKKVVARFPTATIHYDGPVEETRLAELFRIAAGNPVVVWLPFANKLTSWCKMPAVSKELAGLVRRFGAKLGVWILEDETELSQVCALYAPDYVETTGSLKP